MSPRTSNMLVLLFAIAMILVATVVTIMAVVAAGGAR